jgi:serine protease Do
MQVTSEVKTFLLGLSISLLILVSFFGGALADRVFGVRPLDYLPGISRVTSRPATSDSVTAPLLGGSTVPTESVPNVAERASQSVVTVSIRRQETRVDPFGESIFGFGFRLPTQRSTEEVQRDIGTGFVVGDQGLIITNKHVVNNVDLQYLVVDKDNNEYQVSQIYRDPTNDIALLKVDGARLPSLPLGDSDRLRVGQSVIAIGTALGEFRHTVTTGVVSGLGRGIEAGDPFGGVVESLEDVIQTDAAINPGNSGGPLLDSAGSVIGVNVAVSASGQNIGFAIPINVIKASIDNFNQTGQFNRSFLGVRYRMISEQAALFNEVPQGAYVVEVVEGSSAAEAGLQPGDIITEFAGTSLRDQELATLINQQQPGQRISIRYWRDGQQQTVDVTLKSTEQ